MEYKQFTKGQRVKSKFGDIYTVASQWDCVVTMTDGTEIHPSNIWSI